MFVEYRVHFIYIWKRHHLEQCKPPTPCPVALGYAPDSQQSDPIPPLPGKATRFVYKDGGGRGGLFSLGKRLMKAASREVDFFGQMRRHRWKTFKP